MVLKRDYLLEQVERFTQRLNKARTAAQERKLGKATGMLDELLHEAQALFEEQGGDGNPGLRLLLAEVHAELGLLEGATGGRETAYKLLLRAVDLLEPLLVPIDEETPVDPVLIGFHTMTQLNAGAMCAAAKRFDEARDLLTAVIERLEARIMRPAPPMQVVEMWLGALQNRAAVFENSGIAEKAVDDIRKGREVAERLFEGGMEQALIPAVETSLRLAALWRRSGLPQRAIDECSRALTVAGHAADEGRGAFQAMYLRAKIATAESYFAAGRFGEGEDHIFAAVDTIQELTDPVLVAIDLYAATCQMPDETLQAGNLPRDEVEDSFAELLAKLDTRCTDEALRALARARFDVLVNGRYEAAKELVKAPQPNTREGMIRAAVQAKLVEDLRFAEGAAPHPTT